MIFSSYGFMFLFLPIVFIGYFLLNRIAYIYAAKLWLILASFIFYALGSPSFFPVFLACIVGNYIFGSILSNLYTGTEKRQRKAVLTIGILANVALLGYYKYTNFFITNINGIAHTDISLQHIVLPIGISFFTFQLIAFLVDSYSGFTKSYSILDYLLFITFFPQLIVGPIVHHREMVLQFEDVSNTRLNWDNLAVGLFLFSIGCAKKILVADPLTTHAQTFFNAIPDNPGFSESWWCAIEYTVSYYFDLSGYADMAIGLGKMFNITIPENFNSPYQARNFQDYWQRWHITLSRFLGDYIFRKVYCKGSPYRNYYTATMVTFLVSGFWHGAGWTFILWGLVNGFFVCTASWMKRKHKRFPFVIAFVLTMLGVIVLRVLFVSATFADAWQVYQGMIHVTSLLEQGFLVPSIGPKLIITLSIGLLLCWFMPNSRCLATKFRISWIWLLFAGILIGLSLLRMNNGAVFLYFQF
ncbi:MAG: hypothetical protein LBQ30_08965 [Treponema sp.]|jgi:D-alanyl-lipoteichoic acid acyltransferase DltB (MBOAT superfamily)|nr:hypothetical protein [Treponema sp.]